MQIAEFQALKAPEILERQALHVKSVVIHGSRSYRVDPIPCSERHYELSADLGKGAAL